MSPRVPTVEYARSDLSSAKSSQAAWNSDLSRARSSSLRRLQAGSSLKNVNLTNVRSATRGRLATAALLAATLVAAWAAQPAGAQAVQTEAVQVRPAEPSVTLALLPAGTEPRDLEGIEGLAPGVMSAGLSKVTAAQTYLDITQGNRVFTSLYDRELPVFSSSFGERIPDWQEVVARAESAPADIVPGLLASTLREAGIPATVDRLLATPALIAADREGRLGRTPPFFCLDRRCSGLSVVPATLEQLPELIARLRGDDLLIAIERPPPPEHDTLAVGIAGEGFGGNLTSDTTRTDGFVLATDLAPTILDRYGIAIPDEMSGEPIRAEGEPDAAAVQDRADRMKVVAKRRTPVIVENLVLWIALALLVALATRGRFAGPALVVLGLACVYLPLLLLAGAAIAPSETGERLLVGIGAPVLAALTALVARGWTALAIACGATTGAYALDVLVGSPLTASSLLGPNPGLGVRFFGIGNELEAMLAVLIPVGVGAVLTVLAARPGARSDLRLSVGAFAGAALAATALFAAGRFGADVGAAIVFPAGAAVAIAALPGMARRRGLLLLLLVAPFAGLAVLALIDPALGGDAHLSRSVFEAGGADELADVAERRLRLSARSFDAGTERLLFWIAVGLVLVAIMLRRRIAALLAPVPELRAGLIGGAAAVALGMVANDSGATFLTIGVIALTACLVFVWGHEFWGREFTRPPQAG